MRALGDGFNMTGTGDGAAEGKVQKDELDGQRKSLEATCLALWPGGGIEEPSPRSHGSGTAKGAWREVCGTLVFLSRYLLWEFMAVHAVPARNREEEPVVGQKRRVGQAH